MKKILFTLMLLVGGFAVQAQDNTLTIANFESSDGSFLHVVDDFEACYGNYVGATFVKYTLAANGASYMRIDQDGIETTVMLAPFAVSNYAALFGRDYSYIREVNSAGSLFIGSRVFDTQAKN